MTDAIELIRRCKARWARADDGYGFTGTCVGGVGGNPPFLKATIDNGHFNVFDGDCRVGNAKHAGAFAWSRANPSGKFWKIIGFLQAI